MTFVKQKGPKPVRLVFMAVVMSLLASVAFPLFAQTSVTNTATVSPPDGMVDSNPANDSDSALITVTAVQPDFGACDARMYLSQNSPTRLFQFDTASNPFIVDPVGPTSAITYNAIGYNPVDNYIYGLQGPAPGTLIRIGADGSVEDLGTIANFPVNSVAGEFGPDGTFYVTQSGVLYRIDIPSMTATSIALSQSFNHQDLAWHNGLLYAATGGGSLYSINPANGAVVEIGPTGVPGGFFGGMFGATNGVFGSNNDGGFYRFDLTTGAATLISDLPGSGNNDGAKCPTTPLEFPADLAITKDDGSDTYVPGQDVVYTIVVSNLGPFGVSGATVSDPLPAGITTASWTCGSATGGGVCGVASGTGAIVDAPVNLPADASVTFTLTMAVPVDFTGELTNTATVTSPDGSPDPNPDNNTDSDTNTVEPATVTVEKTAVPVPGATVTVGQTLTYTLTVTITGGPTSGVLTLTDTLGAGLTFGEVTDAGDFSCNGALECTLPAGTPQGTYALTYTASVATGASGTVSNTVVPAGDDDPTCGTCSTQHVVQPNFGSCDSTMYLTQGGPTALLQIDTSSNPFTYPLLGTAAVTYNAAAYNPADNYIYASGTVGGQRVLLRIGSDGSAENLGLISGGGINTVATNLNTGEIGADGFYYVKRSEATNQAWRIDLETRAATLITLSQGVWFSDWAWHNGLLYGHSNQTGMLYAVDPNTGVTTTVGQTGITDSFGAMFGASNGVFGSRNGGGFYQFDLVTGAATLISDSPPSGNNDGAKCPSTPLEFPADLAITKDDGSDTYVPGQDVVYTIVVSNLGPFGVSGATVSDPLPAGITTASWTCGSATGGGVCGVASGTGAIVDAPVNLPADASVTFTLTMAVPVDFTGELTNTATVTSPDGSPDPNPDNNTDSDTNTREFPVIAIAKTADPASGGQVQAGQTITYTLTVTVDEAPTTEPFVLTDTLGAGLSFDEVTDAGDFNCTGALECTLPTGTLPGTYALTYTATVDADATGSVGNSVTGTGGGDDDPECDPCETGHEVQAPTIAVAKTADPASGSEVQPGDTLTYTLTATIAISATTEPLLLTDTLGAGLSFGEVIDDGAFSCAGELICMLPAGSVPGTYAVTYTATVDADATGSVGNSVLATGGGGDEDPTCDPCDTEHDVETPTIAVAKTADPAPGSEVQPGQTLAYTLTATIAISATTEPLLLTDTLGAGLSFGEVTSAGAFACAGELTCTLPVGTLPGTYAVTYTATVNADATGSVGNSVVATGGGGDEDPTCDPCETEHDVEAPTITVAKTADPASGSEVQPGDTLTYTLTATIATSATTEPLLLTDTLGAGLSFGEVTSAGAFACAGELTCTLPAGTLPGTYAVTYTATVNGDATGSVGNSVVATGGGGDEDPECVPCETEHEVEPPTINVAKTADPATGSEVQPGQTLTYTLTATIATSATTEPLVLTDTLGAGLSFGEVTNAGDFSCTGELTCTLPVGTLPGTYAVTYTATVNADATGSVGNSVIATGGGAEDPECVPCETGHEVEPPTINVAKSADPANGSEVQPGDTLTYTLTATIATSATTEPLVLADTLGAGLSFGEVTNAGAFDCVGELTCTLPVGTAPGTYAMTYTATVDADATGSVGNSVVASGGGGEEPGCVPCETEHDVEAPTITVAKTADPASGSEVRPGDTLTYTLTATIATSATTEPLVLADTLGAGLSFGEVTNAGGFDCVGELTCTLPVGALPGTYAVTYTATVNADATGSVGNSVVATGGGGDEDPECVPCETEHDIEAPTITVAKTADPASGSEVQPGDTLSYTLTATIAVSATTEPLVLTDTLGTGLTFGSVTNAGDFNCAGELACTLPVGTLPGTYAVTYTATVNADATGSVGNSVVATGGGGDEDPTCDPCETEHDVEAPTITVAKTADPASGSEVQPGQTLTYTLTATIATSATTEPLVLTDTLGSGLTFGAVIDAGAFACAGELTCTLPVGTLPGTYAVTYTATVDADATGSVGNSVVATGGGGDEDPTCDPCETEHDVEAPTITVAKTADPASGSEVQPGQTLTYTLTATIATSATTEPLVLTDTLGAGLTFGEVTDAGAFACAGELTCTLPSGTLPGSYAVTYTATVDTDATGSVGNSVVAIGGGGDEDPTCDPCETEHDVEAPTITVAKTSDPAAGSEVQPGDTLSYTLTATIAVSATTEPLVLTDTLGSGLTFGAVTDAGAFACSGELTCTLPSGTLPGSYAVTYTATVDADATGSVGNSVVATGGGGDEDPTCDPCETEHDVEAPTITVAKASDPPSGSDVRAGDIITYSLTVTVEVSSTTEDLLLVDTLSGGQALLADSIEAPAGGSCTAVATGLECTLPAGTLPGAHVFVYRTQVAPDAAGAVGNAVVPTGGGGGEPPVCSTCVTEHRLADPVVRVIKSAAPGAGAEVSVGDSIQYTLSVTIEDAAITAPVRLFDTPDAGLTLGALPAGCSGDATGVVCELAAGTVPGVYDFVYEATVNSSASAQIANVVTAEYTSDIEPICESCETSHLLVDRPELLIVKTAGVRSARVGDLVRYTLTIENIGTTHVSGATVVDTPPAGFSYVEGSMSVADQDGAFELAPGRYPLRIGGIDILAGESATVVYLLRVGAGVRHGTQVNEAVAQDGDGEPISNVATAQVSIDADPLIDDSLIFGTVFDDRDGDGWQDSAALSGVRVQGGFASGAYIAGSTTIDRGAGPEPVADASAPLLHGIDVGDIASRQSVADPVEARQVVIRQRLRAPEFAGDFVLTSDEGVTLRMDAAGNVTRELSGNAAKGLNAAEPTVERRVAQGEGGVVVDYVIGNAGIDERGIPGVRIASVDGLLIETDQYGRYHLADVQGGLRGYRNFILKVDPATLPPGATFTTDNPLVRRITPGLPVRFDFGVQLPVQEIPGGTEQLELELGEVVFEPGSAEVREAYLPALERMAQQVDAYGGGTVSIVADGEEEALAFARATAVREALLGRVSDEHRAALTVEVRTRVGEALLAGATEGGALLGTVLFDTDRSAIRPEFGPLLDRVAERLERMGGGSVAIVGHTDVRGSHAYNAALGMRRARAVYEALAQRLSPEVRTKVRVEANDDPAAPVDQGRGQEGRP